MNDDGDAEPDNRPKVLIVEDDEDVAETFRGWIDDRYETYIALRGSEALELLEDVDVDVVLLDRLMPGMSGREVLREMDERGFDPRVAMVTAVEPDFDVISMGFDEYVTKPSSPDELRDTVERLLRRDERDDVRRRYASLRAKQAALESSKSGEELAESDEYAELLRSIEDISDEVDTADSDLVDPTEFLSSLREVEEEDG
ncbi:MAG: response regulator [Halobacteriales archaeon]